MIAGVKKCLDMGDIKGLRYIFLDSLDVDPTFEKYRDDYVVCKQVSGMFEPYIELTKLVNDRTSWNMKYWENLKLDLKKNFAEQRFEHMIEVAKVVYSDKVSRLLDERAAKQNVVEKNEEIIPKPVIKPVENQTVPKVDRIHQELIISSNDKNRINETARQIELENLAAERAKFEDRQKMEAARRELEKQNSMVNEEKPKKAWGIVAIGIILLIAGVIIYTQVM